MAAFLSFELGFVYLGFDFNGPFRGETRLLDILFLIAALECARQVFFLERYVRSIGL